MKHLWKQMGKALIALGILHTVVFVILFASPLKDMFEAGFINSIGLVSERLVAWYGGIMLGGAIILLGCLAQSWTRTTKKPLPRYFGWAMVAMGLAGVLLQPVSGSSLVILLGMAIALSRPGQGQKITPRSE